MGISRDSWRGRQNWKHRVEGTEKQVATGLRHGFRSGLEQLNAERLEKAGVAVKFEETKLQYIIPETTHTYTPDFELPNGILVETKGRLEMEDRKKHILVQAQHPDKDIRFVFQRPTDRISKKSKTTYGQWASANNFKWATKLIPEAWWKEPKK